MLYIVLAKIWNMWLPVPFMLFEFGLRMLNNINYAMRKAFSRRSQLSKHGGWPNRLSTEF